MIKYGAVCLFLGFFVGTALSHFIIYARHFGQKSPIRGFSLFGLLLLVGITLLAAHLYDHVAAISGSSQAVLVGLVSVAIGTLVGFVIRWLMGLGPPPGSV
ncbi:MAG TPA: hypothetical protein EYP25_03525 [Anaerolineae bacterium]|nr:hypothetical protein [Anaerolineae bacterium]